MTLEMTIWQAVLAMVGAFIAALASALVGKSMWDYHASGRIEKSAPYVTTGACEAHREKCCVGPMKKDIATLDARVGATEKRLDDGREDFRAVRESINCMGKEISRLAALLEQALKDKK